MRAKQIGEKHFDERQLQIRGQVFQHALIAAMVLLFANGMLQLLGVEWAHGYVQNMTILLVTMMLFMGEALLRGVFFATEKDSWIPVLVVGSTGLLWGANSLSLTNIKSGVPFTRADVITSQVLAVLLLLMAAAAAWKYVTERRTQLQQAADNPE